ncbi:pantoate--beta-alanine ligase [Actinomyces sp. B33]|uniref:pantoate--beta-alanine ligase n=1 Tax=Actinomyces sp. B33 TaxID=2942131 RepID=UPI00234129D8|nr:pantoate--beta-alanine ligase [Actinomyces sp. B33]MDC4232216.1 pantoate--beta-alanine ligase [Actinomyces sp. B33]
MSERPALVRTRAELSAALAGLTGSRALVMTMGALHEGHLSLVREAATLADHVVVTIFVNPAQFAPGEDFDAYPRTLDADLDALSGVGADLVWAPQPDDVYPEPTRVSIDPGPIGRVLEGASRPTHFAGVALVCTKVVGLVRPDVALYGRKDAQQLAMLRTVFRQLDIPVRVHAAPIVRDDDGVALSSRNRYLSADERTRARALSRGLRAAADLAARGAPAADLVARVVDEIDAEGGIDLDYAAVVDDETFDVLAATPGVAPADPRDSARATAAPGGGRAARILVAARVGTTRLIDNTGAALLHADDQGERR